MAIMIPQIPKKFTDASKEGLMFAALEQLPDSYYVFHSLSIQTTVNNTFFESETDFVIFHPDKGVICLEAKAGSVSYSDGCWRYSNGKPMNGDGPFNQASSNKWKLFKCIEGSKYADILKRCKFLHAVWFPSVKMQQITSTKFPLESDKKILLTMDSFENIERDIDRIFTIDLPNKVITNLSDRDKRNLIENIFAPEFNLVGIHNISNTTNEILLLRLQDEQIRLLNYLDEQKSAIINGLAGTGKTIMAIEKARRHAKNGDKVLFLCYNYFLKQHVSSVYADKNIDFYTIDGLACRLCNTPKSDYDLLSMKLDEMFMQGTFPYDHVIIDEGQDFGKDAISEQGIISLLKMNVLDRGDEDGCFYLFYDKNQMIQSNQVPNYINDADCKLTLYKNCRNTGNIATTSLRLLGTDYVPKLMNESVPGALPKLIISTDSEQIQKLNESLDTLINDKHNSIVILTSKTVESSFLKDYCNDGLYSYRNKKIQFTTCRKFKGLEADAVIVIDIDKDSFEKDGEQIMYVGSSRAKFALVCITVLTEEECKFILEKKNKLKSSKNVVKQFATLFNTKIIA